MTRFLRVSAALLFGAALWAPLAQAAGVATARQAVVQLETLRVEISMSIYDDANEAYVANARKALADLQAPMKATIDELRARDAATAKGMDESLATINGALGGGGEYGKGLLATGYDARIHGDFDTASQKLVADLDKAWKLESVPDPAARATVLASKVVANYVQVSASPFGSYTMSSNTDDSDLNKMVVQLDGLFGDLKKKYAADKAKSATVAKAAAKWGFIRTTILKAGKQSTPTIVYRHGLDIVKDLGSL